MGFDYKKFYHLEDYILNDVQSYFHEKRYLNAFDFFCIIIWKANRAKTNIAKRLLKYNPNLEECVSELTKAIYLAESNIGKLEILIFDYEFRLPMASAILSLLYPDSFTVYDYRVCETLTLYKGIDNIKDFKKLSVKYFEFVESVRNLETHTTSLRDIDRQLWGKSFYNQLTSNLAEGFKK
ncbi:hypothetical protein [Pedobacter nototheniae]|uniref:hypothetical protein n=1 Tax=Pedobacter nototheniae TaxID=2488994 RepID=UPI00292F04BC|nr:hypothetical protein [Pedobacter nototheniae]